MRHARVRTPHAIAVLVGACAAACGGGSDTPSVRKAPAPDARPALAGGVARSPRIANYRITATLDNSQHRITATQTLTWTNRGQSAVDALPFHLYLNAFKNEASVFMKESRGKMRGARMTKGKWGWIDVSSIKVGGTELLARARFIGVPGDETVLEVPLATPVAPNETVSVDMAFTSQLPEVFARTGYKGAFTMVGQWFPKIGVRVGAPGFERWACEPFHAFAEFFADFGTYDVALTVPKTLVVAATGVLVSAVDQPNNLRTFTYRAEDVHDFAWMTDPFMEVISGVAKVEGRDVEVRVYHRPEQREFAKRHLQAGIGSIEQFSALFVPYPWTIMSIIDPPLDAASGAGGMEYPTLVTTAGDSVFSRPGMRLPEYVTIHEVGHNWFQGILASNEPEEAWLDEGVNEWADGMVMARLYSERGALVDWMGFTADVYQLRSAVQGDLRGLPSPIASAAWAFVDSNTYGLATYGKTMVAMRTLENVVGRDRFAAAMKAYAKKFAFQHPTGHDLFTTLREELGEDVSWFVGPAWTDVGTIELAVRTARCDRAHPDRGVFGSGSAKKEKKPEETKETGSYRCEVVVENVGTVPVPVDVEVRFADGTVQRFRWEDRTGSHWHRFSFERSSTITEVAIDPDHEVALGDDVMRREYRLEPDSRASWRAGARVGFWAQTLMSVMGL